MVHASVTVPCSPDDVAQVVQRRRDRVLGQYSPGLSVPEPECRAGLLGGVAQVPALPEDLSPVIDLPGSAEDAGPGKRKRSLAVPEVDRAIRRTVALPEHL